MDEQPAPLVEALLLCERVVHEYTTWSKQPKEMTGEESMEYAGMIVRMMGGQDHRKKKG